MQSNPSYKWIWFVAVFSLFCPLQSAAYSVLTHEAIVDASWKKSIVPLLKEKYPGSTDSLLKEAHAYAYGGAIFADMGYYPFGSDLFTDIVHYVQTGGFVNTLLDEAQDIDEYAFALGALAHYMSDVYGHPLGINVAVPLVYPKVKAKYGDTVTYAEDHTSHLRMEFGFDVLQMARGNYASLTYHDFIGFQVSKPLLERAFVKTYGLEVTDLFTNFAIAVGTFRWTIKNLIPEATKYAWIIKRPEIKNANQSITQRKFRYKMKKANYYEEFGKEREKPPIGSRLLAWLLVGIPKVGPLKPLWLSVPGKEAEKLFMKSFDTVMARYANCLNQLKVGKLKLEDKDFDTGKLTAYGEYPLADNSYEKLLFKLQDDKFEHLTPSIQTNILEFYNNADTVKHAIRDTADWRKIHVALGKIKLVSLK